MSVYRVVNIGRGKNESFFKHMAEKTVQGATSRFEVKNTKVQGSWSA